MKNDFDANTPTVREISYNLERTLALRVARGREQEEVGLDSMSVDSDSVWYTYDPTRFSLTGHASNSGQATDWFYPRVL